MTTHTVTTQAELDDALARAGDFDVIDIRSPEGVWLGLSASGSASVRAFGSASVSASGSASVRAFDSASVSAFDSASVSASGSASVSAFDSASVSASGSASVSASGSASVRASDSASVSASGSASVRASGSASVSASGSASVSASGSASVRAFGSASVRASAHVAVHLHSSRAKIDGGVVIDVTSVDLTDPATWCAEHGITPDDDGTVVLFKAVDSDLVSAHGFAYPIGQTVACDDWRDADDCGGGLHFGPTAAHASEYAAVDWPRYLAVRVALADLRPITRAPGPAKAKAPRCTVLHEVDVHDRILQALADTAGASA